MILADKIIKLRKKNGWSQEDLAERLKVSRQSVSKWESAASVPDLGKIIRLSELCGVSTDYLLKDSLEEEEISPTGDTDDERPRLISAEEANTFLAHSVKTARYTAVATMLCILSPAPLMLLAGLFLKAGNSSENVVGAVGVVFLFFIIAAAVAIFIVCGAQAEKFKYITEDAFELAYGVGGIVSEKRARFRVKYLTGLTAGIGLCIVGPVPIMIGVCLEAPEWVLVFCGAALLTLAAVGVLLIVFSTMVWESFDKVLQAGDYTLAGKKVARAADKIGPVYWGVVVAVYLGVSFYTLQWDRTWIVWPCAAVLFGAVKAGMGIFSSRKN